MLRLWEDLPNTPPPLVSQSVLLGSQNTGPFPLCIIPIAFKGQECLSSPRWCLLALVQPDMTLTYRKTVRVRHTRIELQSELTESTTFPETLATNFTIKSCPWCSPWCSTMMTSLIRALLTNSEILASELFCFLPPGIAAFQVGASLYSWQAEDIQNTLQSNEKPLRFVDCDTPEFFPDKSHSKDYGTTTLSAGTWSHTWYLYETHGTGI